MTTEPGEVYLVDLGMAAKTRPMLVVSRRDDDAPEMEIFQIDEFDLAEISTDASDIPRDTGPRTKLCEQ
jgi:hypothetical protein